MSFIGYWMCLLVMIRVRCFLQESLNKMFRSKPSSLALPPESPLRIEEPTYEGLRHFFLKMMLFYSKQSKSIRQANVIYRRVVSQVDKPVIYDG
ncbi:putative ubiquinol-cytochrome c chaperone, CBP3 [Helianthus debilis subsp. tardiflorus]